MPNLTLVGVDPACSAADEAAAPGFDVLITPSQSLDSGGLRWFLAGLSAVTVVLVTILSLSHLWVAGVFVVADAAFLAIAFVACRRDLKRAERVTIEGHTVVIERFDGKGRQVEEARVPLFGLVVRRFVMDGDVHGLSLMHRHSRTAVARDLSPSERTAFLAAFLDALSDAGWRRRVETVDNWAAAL